MSPSVAPPFPFYIINKDIIKRSFPFRKTFLTPKLDFEARFRNPDFARPECSADLKSRNRTTETKQTGGVRKSVQPKLDFAARFHSLISQLDFDRPACPANPKNRNRTTETEQIGDVRKSAQPKFDFTVRFRNPISQPDFDRPACPADPKSRNRTTETEQTGGEGKFSSPENTPIQRLFYLCPRRLQNPIPDITVRFVRKSAFKPPPAPLLPGKPADRKA